MKYLIYLITVILLSSSSFAQESAGDASLRAYLNERLVNGGLSSAETQRVQRVLGAIDQGRVNVPSKLFLLDGDTVWARDVEPNKATRSRISKSVGVSIEGGIIFDLNWSTRIGRTSINIRSIKIGPGVVGLVIGAASGAAALCAYLGGCTNGAVAEAENGDIQFVPVEVEVSK